MFTPDIQITLDGVKIPPNYVAETISAMAAVHRANNKLARLASLAYSQSLPF